METSELKNKGITGIAWNFVGKIATHVVTFVVSIFLARLLSRDDFGLVAMAMVFISVSQIFMDFGLTMALVQKKNPTEIQINTIFYINLILAIILTLLLVAFSGLIGNFYQNDEVGSIVRVVAFLFILYAANGVQRAMMSKQLKIKQLTFSNLSGALVQGVLGVWLAFSGYGAWSLVYSNIAGAVVTSLVLWMQSSWRPKLLFRLSEIRDLFGFGYKMFLVRLLDTVYVKLDELIIGKMFNSDTLGSYNRAKSFNHMIASYTSDSLSGVFFPVISHLQDDIEQVKRVVVKSLETVVFLVFGVTGLLYLDAESLIVLLFGEKWMVSV
ncbi:MAG: lipopolysaccharide biosynthesis protein, partial [Prevotellaceae bacterium]|nr:lipopolysaccharide biosynthesis protein [Prevotellaceae bacterium]